MPEVNLTCIALAVEPAGRRGHSCGCGSGMREGGGVGGRDQLPPLSRGDCWDSPDWRNMSNAVGFPDSTEGRTFRGEWQPEVVGK